MGNLRDLKVGLFVTLPGTPSAIPCMQQAAASCSQRRIIHRPLQKLKIPARNTSKMPSRFFQKSCTSPTTWKSSKLSFSWWVPFVSTTMLVLTISQCVHAEAFHTQSLDYTLICIAVRLAQSHGLHRQQQAHYDPASDESLASGRLFWSIYCLEKSIAYSRGLDSVSPISIKAAIFIC